ncbi:fructosamine kinase family protein [Maritimibacter sp. UBA3975]|uniref:fructosamine kinase family protein n=1 Tax=Maritimibacter sp. UBA3975 TaxID=1946833 RepID=UPI000C0A3406|nr:fructosamine kinase family protein [Maritimibacter sp. UBA3975]MAM61441.1 aminoglycoside phosphotransferase [Maritimibacter sp.]|tara:strand:+ start:10981 stop:11787 length:807 start_codon:yes stop_codon:yes gene_type:complete
MDTIDRAVIGVTADRIAGRRALHGGDLSNVTMLTLQGGDRIVAKTGPMVDREARMLSAMADAGAPVPAVIGVSEGVLLLEALDEGRADATSWAATGHALRRLHDATGPGYGWDEDYSFGPVGILNAARDDWPDFWAANRILVHAPHLPGGLAPRLANLAEALPRLLPKTPRPALLHGDLWSGNLLFGAPPAVYFIDPACCWGDPEVDLAMLHLFGSPGAAFDESYGPLPPGWEERRAVYTLWPALVHLRLFGAGYRGMVDRLLTGLGV